jgi:hypothetical protein
MRCKPLQLLLRELWHRFQLEELNLKIEFCATRNRADARFTISQLWRNNHAPLLAHMHLPDRLVPAFDHLTNAHIESKRRRQFWWDRGPLAAVDLLSIKVVDPQCVVCGGGSLSG